MEKELAIEQIKERIESELENVKSELNPSKRDQRMNHYLNSYCSLLKVSQSLSKQAIADRNFDTMQLRLLHIWLMVGCQLHSSGIQPQ